jgi:hypothetical protein
MTAWFSWARSRLALLDICVAMCQTTRKTITKKVPTRHTKLVSVSHVVLRGPSNYHVGLLGRKIL